MCERQVALVCQWGVHQFSSIALVLVSVLKLSIHHIYATQALSVHVESAIYQVIPSDQGTIHNYNILNETYTQSISLQYVIYFSVNAC